MRTLSRALPQGNKCPSVRRLLPLVVLAMLFAAPSPAGALVGGAPARPAEAPWAVAFRIYHAGATTPDYCSGEIVAHGVILTASHCFGPHGHASDPSDVTTVFVRLSNNVYIRFDRPLFQITRDTAISCARYACSNDVATFRFHDQWGLPSIPIASASQIASLTNMGVTLFGGGWIRQVPASPGLVYNVYPRWISKSRNGGLMLNQYCQVPTDICVRYTGSGIRAGDSGGALVGWFGGWALLGAVESDMTQTTRVQMGSATSMGDPGVSAWVAQQVAHPSP